MSSRDEHPAVLYVKLIIALGDFAAIVFFGYLEVATPATVPWWLMLVLLSIFSVTIGENALRRLGDSGLAPGGRGGG